MNRSSAEKILALQEALRNDPEYRALIEEHGVLNARFLETMEALTENQRSCIFDYIGLLTEMHTRQLLFAAGDQ